MGLQVPDLQEEQSSQQPPSAWMFTSAVFHGGGNEVKNLTVYLLDILQAWVLGNPSLVIFGGHVNGLVQNTSSAVGNHPSHN